MYVCSLYADVSMYICMPLEDQGITSYAFVLCTYVCMYTLICKFTSSVIQGFIERND